MLETDLKEQIDLLFEESLKNFTPLADEILNKLSGLSEDEKYLMKYIYGNLPISDIGDYGFETYLSFVKHSIFVRENTPWGKSVPMELFLTDVLFPRINNEKIEDHRKALYDIFYKYVKDMKDMYQAVAEINYASLEYGTYRLPSRRTASPMTFLKRTFGRCGEESTFLTAVLRSIGIPARQIYTPRWPHCDDCHAWVEAWCDGSWHYLGACEPEPFLDKGWFDAASARSMLLHCRVFNNTKNYPDKITKEGPVTTLSRTEAYAKTARLHIKVVNEKKEPVKGALISFQLINYAQFSSISDIYTDEKGEASIVTGLGSLNIHVSKDGYFTEKLINTNIENEIVIDFSKASGSPAESVTDFDMAAPPDAGNIRKSLSKEELVTHKEKFKRAAEIRDKRERESIALVSEYTNDKSFIDEKELSTILEDAKLNGKEALKFLNEAENGYSYLLLKALDPKDLADMDAEVLKEHVELSLPYKDEYEKDIFVKYVLNPRISFEEITPFRSFIHKFFTEEERANYRNHPALLWVYIADHIKTIEEKNFSDICASPETMLKLKEGNKRSRDILFVAVLRSIGIAARLNPITKNPEYLKDGEFVSPVEELNLWGRLEIDADRNEEFTYGTNWTIGRLENGDYKTYNVSVKPWELSEIKLPAGYYRIVTANRLPNGNTLNKRYDFKLSEGEKKSISIELRHFDLNQMLLNIKLNDFKLSKDNSDVFISSLTGKEKSLVLWLSAGEEPTEHILNEMADSAGNFNKLDLNIIFIAKDEKEFENKNIKRVMSLIPKIVLCIDRDFYMQEPIARNLYVDPGKLPLVMVTEKGLKAIYAFSGYNVGMADLVAKIVKN